MIDHLFLLLVRQVPFPMDLWFPATATFLLALNFSRDPLVGFLMALALYGAGLLTGHVIYSLMAV